MVGKFNTVYVIVELLTYHIHTFLPVAALSSNGNLSSFDESFRGLGLHVEKCDGIVVENKRLTLFENGNNKFDCSKKRKATLLIEQIGTKREAPHLEVVSEGVSVFKVEAEGKTKLSCGLAVESGGVQH